MQAQNVSASRPCFARAEDKDMFLSELANVAKHLSENGAMAISILEEGLARVDRMERDGKISEEEFKVFSEAYTYSCAHQKNLIGQFAFGYEQAARDLLFGALDAKLAAAIALKNAQQVYSVCPTA